MANDKRSSEPRRERIITHYRNNKRLYQVAGIAGIAGLLLGLGTMRVLSDREKNNLETQLQIEQAQLMPRKENVLCDSVAEKFYIINGDTAYVEVEGMKINEYFERARTR